MKTNVDYYFAKIIQEQKIQDWKAKDFWQAILSHGITENNINRQRLYGLLRKKAHENLLLKKCHPKNQQLSTYTETAKLLSFELLSNLVYGIQAAFSVDCSSSCLPSLKMTLLTTKVNKLNP